MQPYPITLQKGMKKFKGHMFVADSALYFVCGKQGSAWGDALAGSFGLIGAAVKAATAGEGPDAPEAFGEPDLRQAVENSPGSVIFEAKDLELMTHTLWTRMIRWNGQKFGVPSGFPKPLRLELGPWTQRHNVKAKGMG